MASSSDVMSTAAVSGSPKLLEEVDVEDEKHGNVDSNENEDDNHRTTVDGRGLGAKRDLRSARIWA